ncbi:MAG: DNA-3-methyladenine glycosylase [Micrococcales bacterium]|nr:DNA-3-methyladenine glycosylase [Micrococcales bacterium]
MTTDDRGQRGQVPARSWYVRGSTDVARDLLGCHLTTVRDDGEVTVRISEVEAYGGADDPGSHAYRGRTARNGAMFGEPGRLYVYRHLGLHHCANIVAHLDGEASAVLLRAGEVVSGVALARARRDAVGTVGSHPQLASGPGRLAVCLALDLADDGADITGSDGPVVLELSEAVGSPVACGPRVGVSGPGGDEQLYPWRWWLTGDSTVSAYRRAYRKPTSAARSG